MIQNQTRIHEPHASRRSVNKTHLFVTNDDGIEADGLIALVTRLHKEGHPIVHHRKSSLQQG